MSKDLTYSEAAERFADALKPHRPYVVAYGAIGAVAWGESGAREYITFGDDISEEAVARAVGEVID